MSGGQRKRVTFADLVTARLPSNAPQQTPNPRPTETAPASPASAPATPPEQPTEPADISTSNHETGGTGPLETTPPTSDIHLAPALKPADEPVPEAENTSLSPDDSQPPDDSQSAGGSQSPAVRRTFRQAGGSQNDCQPAGDSQSGDDSQSPHDRQPLKEVKGYLKLSNTVVDSLLPTLDVYEQAIFVQLYRLSHGFGNFTCKVSLPALQARTGVKLTSLKQAIARLQARGVVEKVSAEIGFGREQGITYWVSPDGRQTYGDWQPPDGSQSPGDPIKRKEFKETKLKGGLTHEQIRNCPDCAGVGMWYPEGPGKGVARCYHPSLRAKQ